MNIQQHAGFYIAGLTARTNNAHEMFGKGKIGNVWQEFLQPNLVAKIRSSRCYGGASGPCPRKN